RLVQRLKAEEHYEVDEAKRTVAVTEEGIARVEELLSIDNLYDQVHTPLVHYLETALKAKELYKRDRDYIVQNREVLIVDEFTGRTLPGRRWSDGLHQAVEAKESVPIQQENQTLATITIQNYFRLYEKLAGMTGTAKTQATEFANLYGRAPSPSPPTWRVEASTSCSVATPSTLPGRRCRLGAGTTTPTSWSSSPRRIGRRTRRSTSRSSRPRRRSAPRSTSGSSTPAASTSSARSATSHAASTISSVAVRAARATPGRPASTCRSTTTSCVSSLPG